MAIELRIVLISRPFIDHWTKTLSTNQRVIIKYSDNKYQAGSTPTKILNAPASFVSLESFFLQQDAGFILHLMADGTQCKLGNEHWGESYKLGQSLT